MEEAGSNLKLCFRDDFNNSIANLRWKGDAIAELVCSFPKELLDIWLCDAIAK